MYRATGALNRIAQHTLCRASPFAAATIPQLCLFSTLRRDTPPPRPRRLPVRTPQGNPSSTDKGFSLDSLVTSSDDEPVSATKKSPFRDSRSKGGESRDYTQSQSPSKSSLAPTSASRAVTAVNSPVEEPAPPSFLGIVDPDGDVVALESEDEKHLPFLAPGWCFICNLNCLLL